MHPQKHQYLTIVLLATLAPQRLVFYLHLLFRRVSPFFGEKRVKMLRIFVHLGRRRTSCLPRLGVRTGTEVGGGRNRSL